MWASDCRVYSNYLRSEHRQIQAAVTGVEQAIHDAGIGQVDNSQVASKLGTLREQLVRHFQQEEDGGCLEQAVCCCPRLSKAVDRIGGEHRSLLHQLDGLIDATHAGLAATDVTEFSQLLSSFTKHLDAHDAAEDHVLQEAFGNG